eukprot:g57164.t1
MFCCFLTCIDSVTLGFGPCIIAVQMTGTHLKLAGQSACLSRVKHIMLTAKLDYCQLASNLSTQVSSSIIMLSLGTAQSHDGKVR